MVFGSVAKLINEHKHYSLSISVTQVDFRTILNDELRKTVAGPYSLAFFAVLLVNQGMIRKGEIDARCAYLVDSGSAFQHQLTDAHTAVLKTEADRGWKHIGVLAFDIDDRVPALQAADVISWSARRGELGTLTEEFKPLNEVLSSEKPTHAHISLPSDAIRDLAGPIHNWIARRGAIPSLQDILR